MWISRIRISPKLGATHWPRHSACIRDIRDIRGQPPAPPLQSRFAAIPYVFCGEEVPFVALSCRCDDLLEQRCVVGLSGSAQVIT